ncbi:hemolysin family protein [Novipirellula artificiosorum]|uniref:Magnesium and cobalt efflux protein CorC n=1 Tax=Novipirellula artificiosorum TaxID=2528016 RepID=A0A5C6E600_9BACT|nr:hemolysin family protein [Novipirellula artificiosorum]TWU42559.1 Magnesium and cobalt efflux protein CorC [Novipirellula artificiosorum]
MTLIYLGLAVALIILNGFFVAAEFALVKVRISRIEQLHKDGQAFAGTAKWLAKRLDESLSACQLGITMASLALGWVGEPAFAALVEPVLGWVGISDDRVIHVLGFAVAFTVITGLHLVVGEQFPKIFAIRRPEQMLLWCALPLKFSYVVLYPFLKVLNLVTSFLLRLVGIQGASDHHSINTEEEIRALLREAHIHGNLTRNEHSLINNVFEFDDLIVRRVMLPRGEVAFFDVNQSISDFRELVRQTMHTRYPVCDGSLDRVLGVVHIKDLLNVPTDVSDFDVRTIMRPPKKLPETMPISRVLRHFQATHQLMAFVIDEYGTITGMVTLENVLERIVGEVDDEFDIADPHIVPEESGSYLVVGSTPLDEVRSRLKLALDESSETDTIAGLLTDVRQKILTQGDVIELDGAVCEVLEMKNDSATKIRVRVI